MMKALLHIRAMVESDLPSVKEIIDNNEMFPSEYLDEMASGYVNQQTEELWFVLEHEKSGVIAVAFCSPERMTEGTWNLLLIAVLKKFQGEGVGSRLITFVEEQLKTLSVRVLLVETSSLPEYKRTREFYPKCGYKQVAIIPEYYDEGDDKVVFLKPLNS